MGDAYPRTGSPDWLRQEHDKWDDLRGGSWAQSLHDQLRHLLDGDGTPRTYLFNPGLEECMVVTMSCGHLSGSVMEATADGLYGMFLCGELSELAGDLPLEWPQVVDVASGIEPEYGQGLTYHEMLHMLEHEDGWMPLTWEAARAEHLSRHNGELRDLGWIPSDISVETTEGTLVARADADPDYPALIVSLRKPDGMEGQVAVVEHCPARPGERDGYLHTCAWNGDDEDYASETVVNADGEWMGCTSAIPEVGKASPMTPGAQEVLASAAGSPSLKGDTAAQGARHARKAGR